MDGEGPDLQSSPDEPPPFLGQWARLYFAVLVYLLLLIVALYVVSRMFAY